MSAEKIESSKIPTSLFLLSSVLLTATSRSSLEHKGKGAEVGEGDNREEVGEGVAQLGEGEGVAQLGEGEEGAEVGEGTGIGDGEGDDKEEEEEELLSASALVLDSKSKLSEGEELPSASALVLDSKPNQDSKLLGTSALVLDPKSKLSEGEGVAPQGEGLAIAHEDEDEDEDEDADAKVVLPPGKKSLIPDGRRVRFAEIDTSAEDEDELQELLEFLNKLPIKSKSIRELVGTIDSLIDGHNLTSIDALNDVLKRYNINIESNAISINIQ